jgi:hypothetical protein
MRPLSGEFRALRQPGAQAPPSHGGSVETAQSVTTNLSDSTRPGRLKISGTTAAGSTQGKVFAVPALRHLRW